MEQKPLNDKAYVLMVVQNIGTLDSVTTGFLREYAYVGDPILLKYPSKTYKRVSSLAQATLYETLEEANKAVDLSRKLFQDTLEENETISWDCITQLFI